MGPHLPTCFCGWFDAELSEKGAEEAKRGATAIKDAKIEFDICYTSVLKRAIRTLWTILDVASLGNPTESGY